MSIHYVRTIDTELASAKTFQKLRDTLQIQLSFLVFFWEGAKIEHLDILNRKGEKAE